MKIKVRPRLEKLARALMYDSLSETGMLAALGADAVHNQVENHWPSMVSKAENIVFMLDEVIDKEELKGFCYAPTY